MTMDDIETLVQGQAGGLFVVTGLGFPEASPVDPAMEGLVS